MAKAREELFVLDEFTTVVDRTVARIGSAAVAKTIRRHKQQFIAVTCHYDIVDRLQPDWTYRCKIFADLANNLLFLTTGRSGKNATTIKE
jgi:ABC-type ATPase with predicted acetyltransferase domain